MKLPLLKTALLFLPALVQKEILHAQPTLSPVRLQCEYLENPLGIDAAQPRLSWQLEGAYNGAAQSACQVIAGTDSMQVAAAGSVWHTEKISGSGQRVLYNGPSLQPFTRYYWKVRIWNESGQPAESKIEWFETGMMQSSNWSGHWISDGRDIHRKEAPLFRKNFSLHKKIRTARAYIAAAGLFELYINGSRIGNHQLDPVYTRFDRRILYVTHDITSELQQGMNAAGVMLGNGWYNHQSTAVWYFHEAPWRNRPAFCMDIRITYEDGSTAIITTDRSWKTTTGPVIFNSIYTAEHYDARKEIPGWNQPSFNDSLWRNASLRAVPAQQITAQVLHPIRHTDTLYPVSMKKLSDTCYVFSLNRNIAGVSQVKVSGKAGTVLKLKHGERLYPNGRVDISNIDVHYRPTDDSDPFQTDIFILSGKGEEIFSPRFNYKGFQHIEVTSSQPVELAKESLTAYFMHSDVPVAGNIQASLPLINQIAVATNSSYLSNLFGYPTDCPQREKNGWTGDAQIAIETGLYNFDGITIYEKWMADHRDEQQPNGVLPSIIPSNGWGYDWGNGPDWTSTIAIIPWNLYLFYGDSKALADCYDNIKRYVNYIDQRYPTGLTDWGLGDWIPVKSQSPVMLTSTAYYYATASILYKAAALFDKKEDYEKYKALAEKIRQAFNDKYLDRTKASYGSGFQTELSVALYWGLVPDDMRKEVAATLAKKVKEDGIKLDVGLLGTKAILNALSENGYHDLAYQLATADTYPSWGWWIKNGATTLYENWPIDAKSDISMNHIMFGEIGAWFYKALGGIRPDENQPGFKHVWLQPLIPDKLQQFSATHTGPYGNIESAWEKTKKGLRYKVVIPPNSSATVVLDIPPKKAFYINNKKKETAAGVFKATFEAGTYELEWK